MNYITVSKHTTGREIQEALLQGIEVRFDLDWTNAALHLAALIRKYRHTRITRIKRDGIRIELAEPIKPWWTLVLRSKKLDLPWAIRLHPYGSCGVPHVSVEAVC